MFEYGKCNTRFSYKGNDYTILADTVSNGGLGEWIGYIRQLCRHRRERENIAARKC
ncbi:MAG: NisI/SpaI family lantibiotic immunity lipoprotein [Blautia wexlerae]